MVNSSNLNSASAPRGVGWALVTGASGGLGSEFATALAGRGMNLVLAARRTAPMEQLASTLRDRYGVEVRVEGVDLGRPDSAAALLERLDAQGVAVDVLINNAGFGLHGDFVDQAPERVQAMLELNVSSLTALTHACAARMVARGVAPGRGRGRILLVASLTAYQPVPSYAAYAASKAYVRSFGEALHAELAPRGVTVTVLSPGLMDTGFLSAAGQAPNAATRRMFMPPRAVVAVGLRALFAGKPSVVAGRMNRVLAFSNRFTSRRLQASVAYRMNTA